MYIRQITVPPLVTLRVSFLEQLILPPAGLAAPSHQLVGQNSFLLRGTCGPKDAPSTQGGAPVDRALQCPGGSETGNNGTGCLRGFWRLARPILLCHSAISRIIQVPAPVTCLLGLLLLCGFPIHGLLTPLLPCQLVPLGSLGPGYEVDNPFASSEFSWGCKP